MLTRQLNKIFNNKAQSILELAIFGSIIIFLLSVLIQYGLSLNYQQHLSMQTFRKALQIAAGRSTTSPQVSLTVVKDAAMPEPSNPFGVTETSPVIAGANVVISRDIHSFPQPTPSDYPRIDFMINGKRYIYTTGTFKKYNCSPWHIFSHPIKKIKKKKTNYDKVRTLQSWDTVTGKLWYWDEVADRTLATGDVVEIAGKPRTIVDTEGDDGNIDAFWYLDPTSGQIDTTIQAEEGPPQGLQPGYTKEVTTQASIEKTETSSGISTTRKANVIENIKRIIKTNQGEGDQPVSSEVKQDKTSTWQTNW